MPVRFSDRRDAGRQLALRLHRYAGDPSVTVLGISRGGVPVASAVAQVLDAPLGVCVVRAITAPLFPEFPVGAVAGPDVIVLDDDAVQAAQLSPEALDRARAAAMTEWQRQSVAFAAAAPHQSLRARTVLLVDDGLASSVIMEAAVRAVRVEQPTAVVVAVPIAGPPALDRLATVVDACIAVETSLQLDGVGSWYQAFRRADDREVITLLEEARRRPSLPDTAPTARSPQGGHIRQLIAQLQRAARPLVGAPDDIDALLPRLRDATVVLIGEASHGTHEFYRMRQELTRRLIAEAGFTAVAAEADWPSAYRVDQYVRGAASADPDATTALAGFRRFPQWMWRNADVLDFVGWLRQVNDARGDPARTVGFFGLDLYSLHESMGAVIAHLRAIDPEAAQRAAQRYECFEPFGHDPVVYGRVTQMGLSHDCEHVALAQLQELQDQWRALPVPGDARWGDPHDAAHHFAVEQNARVVRNAERYYRTMFQPRQSSWNLREHHMMDTLRALRAFLGRRHPDSKLVVWAHNSHVGDARATSQGEYGEVSLGQLCRETWGRDVALVGFTTYTGTVLAADDWDHPGRHMAVRPALEHSVEWLLHETGIPAFAITPASDPVLQELFDLRRLFRAIGVVYRPQTERQSHYVQTALSQQFDVVLHYDRTRAVEPLESTALTVPDELPDTYPSAL